MTLKEVFEPLVVASLQRNDIDEGQAAALRSRLEITGDNNAIVHSWIQPGTDDIEVGELIFESAEGDFFTTFDTIVFNENGLAVDLRMESDTDENQFFLSGTNNAITIGSTTELAKFGIDGNADEIQFAVQAHSSQTANIVEIQDSAGNADIFVIDGNEKVGIGTASPQRVFHVNSGALDVGFRLTSTDTSSKFELEDSVGFATLSTVSGFLGLLAGSGTSFHLRINSSGDVGINKDTSMGAQLHVVGDSDKPVLMLDANPTQNANLVEFRDSNDNVGFAIEGDFDVIIGAGAADKDYTLTFNGETNDGVITWLEDEDEFSFDKGLVIAAGDLTVSAGFLNLGPPVELTIADGEITVTQTPHTVDTQSDNPTDNLDTINGGTDGDILILKSVDSARDVELRDGNGNLRLEGNFTLDSSQDRIILEFSSPNWYELSRANNGA
jgi:hypothetical protein